MTYVKQQHCTESNMVPSPNTDDPSICVDVTSKTAAHFDFDDVLYYSLKAWLHWTEDGQPHTLYIQHYRLHQADHGSQPHSQWGPLKPSRVDFRFKQLRMTLTDGTIVPVYGDTGTYLIHETGGHYPCFQQKASGTAVPSHFLP